MKSDTETSMTLEIRIASDAQQAGRRWKEARFQVWCCATLSGSLLLAGAWLLLSSKGPESVASDVLGNAAATIWLCIPTLLFFLWQGYRKMKAAEVLANGNETGKPRSRGSLHQRLHPQTVDQN